MSDIRIANKEFQNKLKDIADNYLDKISPLLIEYYNDFEEIDKNLKKENQILQRHIPTHIVIPTQLNKSVIEKYSKLEKELENLLNDMMEDVYRETSKMIRNTYGNLNYPISKINFFNKDGKTIKSRLQRWFCPYIIKPDPSGENYPYIITGYNGDFVINKLKAISKIDIILSTECSFEAETIKKDKLNGLCEWVEVCYGGGDCNSDCQELCGEYPINEYPEPPFHSNCGCYTSWLLSDDIEDVEDLDLEDDLDEEYYEDEIEDEIKSLEKEEII